MTERFTCRNCDADIDGWEAASEHADDEDHLVDIWTRMSTVTPGDVR